jgi:hypothetical protein
MEDLKLPLLFMYVLFTCVERANDPRSPGVDPGFQVRGGGAHLKKLRRAKGGAKICGVFRVQICRVARMAE